MWRFMYIIVAAVMVIACSSVAEEQEIRIRGYHDGTLTFNQVSNAAYYRVAWASKATGPWSVSWDGFQSIAPTTNDEITVFVPKFYRVSAVMKGTLYGLIAHYSFDEPVEGRIPDKASPGNYGDRYGTTWVETNAMGGAYYFDGVDDYIELGRTDIYQAQGSLSGCAWVRRESRETILFSNYRGGSTYNGHFEFLMDSEGNLYASLGQAPGVMVRYLAAEKDILPSNAWHHVAFTYDERRGAGQKIKFYLDGVEIESYVVQGEGNGGPILQTSDQIRIMANRASIFAKGMVHEVMLFDRTLSAAEVKQIYDMQ